MTMRRVTNVVLAASLLLLCLPLLACFAILVKLDSPGGAIFAQPRIGKDGSVFTCYKLRTMVSGTPNAATHNVSKSQITRIGAFMRHTKVDELPQLWNVIRGDMDFVGPRPCLESQPELIEERQARGVLDVRPGITGLAQIRGIDMSEPTRLAEVDAEYIKMRSLSLDLNILLKTLIGAGSGDRAGA